jgi:PHD-finger
MALGSLRKTKKATPAPPVQMPRKVGRPRNTSKEEDDAGDDLWCTHCMDDPAVALCSFCGCRVRTGACHFSPCTYLIFLDHSVPLSSCSLSSFCFRYDTFQSCFGKHDSEYLLLCDHCDQESHTYCLEPQLTEVPADAWYCKSCVIAGHHLEASRGRSESMSAGSEADSVLSGASAATEQSGDEPMR